MKSDSARDVLLVHALETADGAGSIDALGHAERTQANKAAAGDFGMRARLLREPLERKHRAVRAALAATRSHAWLGWTLVVVCLMAGFFSNKLGDSRVIDVLAFPLLGLAAWSVLVYLAIAVGAISKGRGAGWMTKLFEWGGEHLTSRKVASDAEGPLARGLRDFAANWLHATAAIRESRIRALLHIAAAALAVGMVGGMYWKGLAVEYKAGWESTFITQAAPVQRFYGILFKPASAVSGIPVPTLAEVDAARRSEGQAAKWIHLFAVTVLLVVFLPRFLLAIASWRRARRLEGEIDVESLDPSYFRRLEKATQGGNAVALVIPHRIDPDSALREAVRSRLHDRWGGALVIEFGDAIGYGDEENIAERLPQDRECGYVVLLMNLASTPEEESQGLLADGLRAAVPEAERLALLDPTSLVERLDGMPEKERRIAERTQAWQRLLGPRSMPTETLETASPADRV